MRVIIAGCRHLVGKRGQSLVWDAINESGWAGDITEIVHGAAVGIDAAAHAICEPHWPVKPFPADWDKHGKAAGPIRNYKMAEYADALIAIWDGKSRGTDNMIKTAKKLKLKVYVHMVQSQEANHATRAG